MIMDFLYIVEDNGDIVMNCIKKDVLSISGTSVFSSVVAVISNYCVPWFKVFQTDVALSCPTELSLLFRHKRFH